MLPQINTLLWDSLTAIPKNPLICKSDRGEVKINFFGLSNYPKLPDPHRYSSHILFKAPEWYPAYIFTILDSYWIWAGKY